MIPMMSYIWFSDVCDAELLAKSIRSNPDLVFVHQGTRRSAMSLLSVLDDQPSIRLYPSSGKTFLLVKRVGRQVIVQKAGYAPRGRRKAAA
jgi:hypothetical protein